VVEGVDRDPDRPLGHLVPGAGGDEVALDAALPVQLDQVHVVVDEEHVTTFEEPHILHQPGHLVIPDDLALRVERHEPAPLAVGLVRPGWPLEGPEERVTGGRELGLGGARTDRREALGERAGLDAQALVGADVSGGVRGGHAHRVGALGAQPSDPRGRLAARAVVEREGAAWAIDPDLDGRRLVRLDLEQIREPTSRCLGQREREQLRRGRIAALRAEAGVAPGRARPATRSPQEEGGDQDAR
jgi:hypothetical protein